METLQKIIRNCKNDTCIFNTKDYVLYDDAVLVFKNFIEKIFEDRIYQINEVILKAENSMGECSDQDGIIYHEIIMEGNKLLDEVKNLKLKALSEITPPTINYDWV